MAPALAGMVALIALPSLAAVMYLTTGGGTFLLDQYGCRLIGDMGQSHAVLVSSSWPGKGGIVLTLTGVVKDDGSGILIRACSYDPAAPIAQSVIETVDSTGAVKILNTCTAPVCEFDLAKSAMHPGSNDVWLVATTAAGLKYGATTKMSPP